MIVPAIPVSQYETSVDTTLEVSDCIYTNLKTDYADYRTDIETKGIDLTRDDADITNPRTSADRFDLEEGDVALEVSDVKNRNFRRFDDDAQYSQNYINFNTSSLIEKLQPLVSDWVQKGTENSISEVAEIKRLIEKNSKYLEQTSENRILLGLLETIFEENKWESISKPQLQTLSAQLNSFRSGKVNIASLDKFARHLWQVEIL